MYHFVTFIKFHNDLMFKLSHCYSKFSCTFKRSTLKEIVDCFYFQGKFNNKIYTVIILFLDLVSCQGVTQSSNYCYFKS